MNRKSIQTPLVRNYIVAVLLAITAQLARIPLHEQTEVPFITYVPFVLLSAFVCGFGPGLLTSALCVLEAWRFSVEHLGNLWVRDLHDWIGMAVLLLGGVTAAVFFDRLRQAIAAEAEAKEAQAKLAAELQIRRQMLETIIQHAPVGIALLNSIDFRFEMVNPEYQGFAPGEIMVGRTVEAIWPQAAELLLPLLHTVRDSQTIYHADGMAIPRQREPGGEVEDRFFDFSYLPIRRDGGKDQVLVVAREVTAYKRAEQALRIANDDLRQFAYAVTHDLLEPLRNINTSLAMIERARNRRPDQEVESLLSQTVQDCRRLRSMLTDLYDYTKIAAAEKSAVKSDASAVLQQVLDNLRESVSESQATVTYTELPPVAVREIHLLQLFQNLIGNALKFRDGTRAPRIEISAAQQQRQIQFTVADNGIGFDPQHATSIFEIFKRLHGVEEYSGSGMGLAICARIAATYGGRIWAESKPGAGATFRFTLPAFG